MTTQGKQLMVELFATKGVVSRTQLAAALEEERQTGDSIFRILPRMGVMTQDDMVAFIAANSDIQRIELEYLIIDPKVIEIVPEDFARKHFLVPAFCIRNTLTCAMVDVFNVDALDELSARTGLIVEPALATERDVMRALERLYSAKGDMQGILMADGKSPAGQDLAPMSSEFSVSGAQSLADEAPVVTFINSMITKAIVEDASDIHVEPEENTLTIRFRIDGVLHTQVSPPKQYQAAIISRIKIMAELDIAESRRPQDGRIQMRVGDRHFDIRVSSLPTVYGENIVLRLLDTSGILMGLEQIGFQEPVLSQLRSLLQRPDGILLVTGPTGSGKTTTLYSAVNTINDPQLSIVTIEDPVEYRLPGVRQTQVNTKVDLTFAHGLRAILRQDPDVVMVGEIRDVETAQIAIQAALTGHLVLATLHTNNAAGAVTRLLDIGVESFLLASSIIGVLAQRLVRLICKECHGRGCDACLMTGYKGRTCIYELITFDKKIRSLMIRKASTEEIHRTAIESGMRSMRDNGMDKVSQGLTTQEEVFQTTQNE